MRPRFVINKGIAKEIIAVSSHFTIGTSYTSAIYNRADRSKKITATATASAYDDGRPSVTFVFPAYDQSGNDTNALKEGTATIEIYDNAKNIMVYREDFAIIRKNSLPISVAS